MTRPHPLARAASRLAALVALACALALWAPAARATGIPPGQEALARAMLDDGPGLPDGCRWDGTSIGQDRLTARYRCPSIPDALVLVAFSRDAPEAAEAARTTQRFALRASPAGRFPAPLLDALAARVASGEGAWVWSTDGLAPVADASPATPTDERWPRGALPLLVGLALASVLSLALAWRARRSRPAPTEAEPPTGVLARLLALGALLAAASWLARFRLVFDDFRYLERALHDPWRWDDTARWLSTSCLFRLAVEVAPHGVATFAVANALALALAAACLAALARGLGLARDEAWVAAALFALAPGAPDLLRRAAGIENLGAAACVLGVLVLVQRVARDRASRRDAATSALVGALTLAAIGVLVKYPWMAVVPPAAWLVWRASPASPPARGAWIVAAALAAVLALSLALALPRGNAGMLGEAGLAHLRDNLAQSERALAPFLDAWARGLALLVAVRLARAWRASGPAPAADALTREAREALRDARSMLLGRTGPRGLAFGPLALALAALLLAPALFNAVYFARHYVLLAAAPLALLAARSLFAVGHAARAPRAALVVAALALVPWPTLRSPDATLAAERAEGWLREVGALATARGGPEPATLLLAPACATRDDDARTVADLRDVLLVASVHGVRWITGWHRTEVVVAPTRDTPAPPGAWTLSSCLGRTLPSRDPSREVPR